MIGGRRRTRHMTHFASVNLKQAPILVHAVLRICTSDFARSECEQINSASLLHQVQQLEI